MKIWINLQSLLNSIERCTHQDKAQIFQTLTLLLILSKTCNTIRASIVKKLTCPLQKTPSITYLKTLKFQTIRQSTQFLRETRIFSLQIYPSTYKLKAKIIEILTVSVHTNPTPFQTWNKSKMSNKWIEFQSQSRRRFRISILISAPSTSRLKVITPTTPIILLAPLRT